jgi:hypothetical protein
MADRAAAAARWDAAYALRRTKITAEEEKAVATYVRALEAQPHWPS